MKIIVSCSCSGWLTGAQEVAIRAAGHLREMLNVEFPNASVELGLTDEQLYSLLRLVSLKEEPRLRKRAAMLVQVFPPNPEVVEFAKSRMLECRKRAMNPPEE